MIKGHRIIFTDRLKVELQAYDFDDSPPGDGELILQMLCTAVSSGTELASLTNEQDIHGARSNPYPCGSGYAGVGKVIAAGNKVENVRPGDVVFVSRGHASHHRVDAASVVPVPDNVPPEDAVYIRLCGVSMTTLITTSARPGDGVAVFGLGIIGNTAAQVFQASGYEVVGIEPAELRRKLAEKCGLRHTLSPEGDIVAGWKKELGETPCRLVVETSGTVYAVRDATTIADIGAEIVLVGVPWKKTDALTMSELVQPIFLKYLHVRGGWEWEIPVQRQTFARGSLMQNYRHAMNLLARGEIKVAPLRSHLLSPAEAQSAYLGLLNDKETYQSVVFDWTRLV